MYNQYQQQPQQPQQFGGQQYNVQPQTTGYGSYFQQQASGQGQQQPQQQQQQQQQQQYSGLQGFSNVGALNQQPTGFNQTLQPQQTTQQPMQQQSTFQNAFQQPMQQQTTQPNTQQPMQQQYQQPMQQPMQQQMQQPILQQNTQQPLQQPGQLYQQSTGYNGLMPQTSFGQNQPAQMGLSTGNAPVAPLKPQQTGFYSQQQPMEPLKPTATGFINSFASSRTDNNLKIPAIRLSFITTQDQAKFETLFRSVVTPGSNTISGEQCRSILVKSGLQPSQLAKIWTLADTNKAGELLFPEFALAMYLVNSVLRGDSIPYELDTKTKNEVTSFVDAINFSIANDSETEQKQKTPFDDLTAGISMIQPQATGYMPQLSFGGQQQPQQLQQQMFSGLTQQPTGGYSPAPQTSFANNQSLQPQSTGSFPQNSFSQPLNAQNTGGFTSVLNMQSTGTVPSTSFMAQQPLQAGLVATGGLLQPQATGYLPPSNFQATMPLQAQKTGFGNNDIYTSANIASKFIAKQEDSISPEEKSLFYKIFETYDTEKTGNLNSATAVEIFRKSGLNRSDLEHIWNLCDTTNSGNLNKQEFALGMHLVYRRINGEVLPNTLPPSLIPSSTRILNTVKDQLKQGVEKSGKQLTKDDGLRFKNNDDELLPSSRNRRKTIDQRKKTDENKEKIENLKRLINEKRNLVNSEKSRIQRDKEIEQNNDAELLRSIERLKSEIQSLPEISKTPGSDPAIPRDLQSKFDSLTVRLPELLSEISQVSNELNDAQLKLYRLKSPSSIIGTGPHGEITDYDRKKAKQKQILASRMAALTGKSVDDSSSGNLEVEEQRYNEEVSRIQRDHERNQSIIHDISSSIQDISLSVHSAIHGVSPSSNYEMSKWESGVGLEPEVRDFIISWKNRRNFKPNGSQASFTQGTRSINSSHTQAGDMASYSDYSSPDDRAEYVKQQAKKKMEEKLAALGIKKKSSVTGSNSNSPQISPSPQQSQTHEQEISAKASIKGNVVSSNVNEAQEGTVGEDESEEEEERRLLRQLEMLKLKKKERASKLSGERKAVDPPQSQEPNDGHDSWDEEPTPTTAIPVTNGSELQAQTHHAFNPFGKTDKQPQENNQVKTETVHLSNTPTGGRNPFFKQTAKTSSTFDLRAAEQQRRSQRGLDDSDGWSDDDAETKKEDDQSKIEGKNAVPVAPPLPQLTSAPENGSSIPVPVAPPLPKVDNSSFIPPPPPLPTSITGNSSIQPPPNSTAVPTAAPLPQVHSGGPPVPVAPPIPQLGQSLEPASNSITDQNADDASDVLSIPESVASEDNEVYTTPPPEQTTASSIPPAPPVPTIPPPPPMP